MRLRDKVVAVAGGAGGIGTAVSQRLAQEGAQVVVGDIDRASAESVAAAIVAAGGRAEGVAIDIGDEASVAAFVETASRHSGSIDGFHVNALDGSLARRDTDPVSIAMDDYDRMMAVNMRGYFLCTRHAVPRLLARGGCMLYTSSDAVYLGMDSQPTYAMAKSGIHALARHVARRFGKQGVRANVISPGLIFHAAVDAIMPPGTREANLRALSVPRVGEPRDIAAVAAMLLSDDGSFITGQVICVDGGATMRA